MLKDQTFWISYLKFIVTIALAGGLASFVLGVPKDVMMNLAVGAALGFPAAFALGMRQTSHGARTTG